MIKLEEVKKIAEKIGKEYNLEKVILFGSFAWGRPGPDSDIDLFIIKETKNTRETAKKIDGSIFPRPFPIDILVYSPEQLKRRQKMNDFFIKDILTKGKVLYSA